MLHQVRILEKLDKCLTSLRKQSDNCRIWALLRFSTTEQLNNFLKNIWCLLTPVVLKKIPQDIKLAILRNTEQTEKFDLESLMEKFKKELEAREEISFLSGDTAIACSNSAKYTRSQQPATASALFPSKKGHYIAFTVHNTILRLLYTTPYCVYCTQQHRSTKCTVVTNIDARKAILRKKRNVFLPCEVATWTKIVHQKLNVITALKPTILACDSLKKSRVKVSSATPSIIPGPSGKIEQVQSQQQQSSIRGADEQILSGPSGMGGPPQRVKLVNCFISAKNSLLIQSARTVITDPNNPSLEVNVRVFLNSCSQRSYTSQCSRDVLKLPSQSELTS